MKNRHLVENTKFGFLLTYHAAATIWDKNFKILKKIHLMDLERFRDLTPCI